MEMKHTLESTQCMPTECGRTIYYTDVYANVVSPDRRLAYIPPETHASRPLYLAEALLGLNVMMICRK